jgi:predicted RNA-binding Zn-ribbon protein involved in translation (DUF1610 family)
VVETCESCGGEFERASGRRKKLCPDCKRTKLIENMDSQRERAGEHYEQTVVAQLRYWTKEARRLGIFYDGDDVA